MVGEEVKGRSSVKSASEIVISTVYFQTNDMHDCLIILFIRVRKNRVPQNSDLTLRSLSCYCYHTPLCIVGYWKSYGNDEVMKFNVDFVVSLWLLFVKINWGKETKKQQRINKEQFYEMVLKNKNRKEEKGNGKLDIL